MKNARLLLLLMAMMSIGQAGRGQNTGADSLTMERYLGLEQCLALALEHNHQLPVAEAAVDIARAQRRQALSVYWPSLSLRSLYTVMDEAPETIFPASKISLSPFSFGGIQIPLAPIAVPAQNVKLMDPHNLLFSANLIFPLYLGGLRTAFHKQADLALALAREEVKRSDQQVVWDVKRYYYGAVLARNLYEIAQEALIRLEVTLELTENLYKNGTGRVQKTDYLKNQVIVENVRALVATLKNNENMARAALTFTLGTDWQTPIQVAERDIPFPPVDQDVDSLLEQIFRTNPDWVKIQLVRQILSAQVNASRSEYWPQIAVIGGYNHLENSYQYGMVGPNNRDLWMIGISLQMPVFTGFRRQAQVQEAQARLEQIQAQEIQLREGLKVQIQNLLLRLAAVQEREKAFKMALTAAVENRDLTERAYQQELKEEKDLIESQIYESMAKAQYQKILYDGLEIQLEMDFFIGSEIAKQIESGQ